MSAPTDEEMIAAALKAVTEAKARARHWDGEVCPICKASLHPNQSNTIGYCAPMQMLRQMHANLERMTGYCGECLLSPAEVEQNEIGNWVWVRTPPAVSKLTNSQPTVKAKGRTIQEVTDDIGQRHLGYKEALLAAISPAPALELSINWVPINGPQALETPVKGGDYVKFRDQTELELFLLNI